MKTRNSRTATNLTPSGEPFPASIGARVRRKEPMLARTRALFRVNLSIGLLLVASAVLAQSPQFGPLNPEFVEYLAKTMVGRQMVAADAEPSYGLVPPCLDLSHLRRQSTVQALRDIIAFPPSYDLRTLGRVTPVRDQGYYGTCWAFATFGSLESCLLPSENRDFSENNLANLAGFDLGFGDGGNDDMSTAYLARWSGLINETDDPYPNPGGSPPDLTVRKHVQQVRWVPPKTSPTGNDEIKQALMDHGAVYVTYYHNNAYYNSTYKTYRYTGTHYPNHAVTLVGWDDNFDKNKFASVPPGNGAYIVKNSWGTGWGENGYFYVSYYDTQFGDRMVQFLNAEATNNYATIYSYDPLGCVASAGTGTTTLWGANIFTAADAENLAAVGFYALSVNTSYEIYIYKGVSASAPRSGTLAATQTGTCSYPGYRTISLDTPVALTAGQRFSVVLKLTTPGYNYPQACEFAIPGYSSGATAGPGQSYYSSSGTSWSDLTSFDATANFCIKGYTKESSSPPPPPPPGYLLTLIANPTGGGTIILSPGPGAGGTYDAGTVVQLTANPATGYSFISWSGDAAGSRNPAYVTMAANKTVTANYAPIAQMVRPEPGTTLTGDWVNFEWAIVPRVAYYALWVGSKTNAYDIHASWGTSQSKVVRVPTDGRQLYVTLWTLSYGQWRPSRSTNTAHTAAGPEKAVLSSPADGTTLTGDRVNIEWTSGVGVALCYLWVGSNPNSYDLYCGRQSSLSRIVKVPTNGKPIYVTLWSCIYTNGAWRWQSDTRSYTAYTAAGPEKAQMHTPTPGSVLTSGAVKFEWTSGVGATRWGLWVGSNPNSYDLYWGVESGLSRALTLPTDGRTLYVRLCSLINGVWQWNDYQYTASGP